MTALGESVEANREAPRSTSKSSLIIWIPLAVSVSGVLGGAISWAYSQYIAREEKIAAELKSTQNENKRILETYLYPLRLKVNKARSISDQLKSQYNEKGFGILESYIIRARKDGPEKHSLFYALITDLVQANIEMRALLEAYNPWILSSKFRNSSDDFLDYVHAYIIRYKQLPEVVKNSEAFPVWKDFPGVIVTDLDREIILREDIAQNKLESPTARSDATPVVKIPDVNIRSPVLHSESEARNWCSQQVPQLKAAHKYSTIKDISEHPKTIRTGFPLQRSYTVECRFSIIN